YNIARERRSAGAELRRCGNTDFCYERGSVGDVAVNLYIVTEIQLGFTPPEAFAAYGNSQVRPRCAPVWIAMDHFRPATRVNLVRNCLGRMCTKNGLFRMVAQSVESKPAQLPPKVFSFLAPTP